MNNKYSDQEKQTIISRYLNGESVASIVSDSGVPRSKYCLYLDQTIQEQTYRTQKQSIITLCA